MPSEGGCLVDLLVDEHLGYLDSVCCAADGHLAIARPRNKVVSVRYADLYPDDALQLADDLTALPNYCTHLLVAAGRTMLPHILVIYCCMLFVPCLC